jgi:hypothetical protein
MSAMIFIDNKYTNWYYKIIHNATNRVLTDSIYTEKHHIIPRSLGGDNSIKNLVKLTAREHFVCHLLLTKMVDGQTKHKMLSAVTKFQQSRSYQKRNFTSWEYQQIRVCAILARTGQKHTAETKQKIKDKHHNVSGKNNPRARHIRATSPNGTVYDLVGTLKAFCKDQKLGYSTVLRMLSIHPQWNRTYNGSTKGWTFVHMD